MAGLFGRKGLIAKELVRKELLGMSTEYGCEKGATAEEKGASVLRAGHGAGFISVGPDVARHLDLEKPC